MHSRVVMEPQQHFRPTDVENLGKFPQAGDEALTEDWLGTLRYRGLAVVKDGANNVVVSPGRAYINFRQFALDTSETKSLVDEKPLIAGQKRVVILAAQGQPDVPGPGVSRNATIAVPDGNGGSVKQTTTQTATPYLANKLAVAKIAGALSTQELDPSVPADNVPFARVVLDIDGIVSAHQLTAHRINSVIEMDAIIAQQASLLDIVMGEVQALRNEVVGIQGTLRSTVSHAALEAVLYDVATLKDMQDIDDAGAPYALDRLLDEEESDTDHPDYNARIDEGLQLPYANENRTALALNNVNDPRVMHANAGLLFPTYDPVIGFAVHSAGDSAPLGGTVLQTMSLVQLTRTRFRVRYGNYYFYRYYNLPYYHPLRLQNDIVWRVFRKYGEVLAYPYGYYANAYLYWYNHFYPRVFVDVYREHYHVWQKVDRTIEGVIKCQTFQQSQERYIPAFRLGLLSWESGAEITIAMCETREDGTPDPTKVLATKTLTASAFKRYTAGNVETMTRFQFDTPAFAKRGTYGFISSVSGQVTVAMASGDRFLGGNNFESTDGSFFVGSILKDWAFAVEYCKFRQTVLDARLQNLNLNGGIQNADVVCPATVPDNTTVQFRVHSGGGWKVMAQVPADPSAGETEEDEIFGTGLQATYDFQAYLTGNQWVMPVLELGNAELTVFRSGTEFHHVGAVRTVPGATTWAKVIVRARIAGYDAVRHTLDAWIMHGATLATQKLKDGAPTVVPVPGNDAVDVSWTFTVDPTGDQYQVHVVGETNNIAFPLSALQIYSKVEE